MSEAPREAFEVHPFQKNLQGTQRANDLMPDGDARPMYPFTKNTREDAVQNVSEELEELDVADPKDESAVASVASLESQTPSEPIVLGTTAQDDDSTSTVTGEDADKVISSLKENESSSQPSSSPTSPGWDAPPAPVAPPTSD